jgi:hypothetical protein
MANFKAAPQSSLIQVPHSFSADWQTALKRPGTYSLFDADKWRLIVPNNEGVFIEKGQQSRLIAMWGGQDGGGRLQVEANPKIQGLKIELVSETPVAPHLWLWCITAELPMCLAKAIETKLVGVTVTATPGKPVGTVHAGALPLSITPEMAAGTNLPIWGGGPRDRTRDAIVSECERQGVRLKTQVAYILATAEHESGFRPTREGQFGGADPQSSERFRRGLRYYPYYGRGYVQLTHKGNYATYGTRLGIDLVNDPDLALQPNVALFVLVHGVMNGSFGTALTSFVNDRRTDFVQARRSVNGLDKAERIAAMAQRWLTWLRATHPNRFPSQPQAQATPRAAARP